MQVLLKPGTLPQDTKKAHTFFAVDFQVRHSIIFVDQDLSGKKLLLVKLSPQTHSTTAGVSAGTVQASIESKQ